MSVNSNYDAIMARSEAQLKSAARECEGVLKTDYTKARKYFRLVEIANDVMTKILPNTPCKKGCNHCCNIQVVMTEREAWKIGLAIKRAPKVLPKLGMDQVYEKVQAGASERYGQPCTFLGKDGSCEIYDVRPMACRKHHSLNDTNAECETVPGEGEKRIVPQVDIEWLCWSVALIEKELPIIGDIREFFPKE